MASKFSIENQFQEDTLPYNQTKFHKTDSTTIKPAAMEAHVAHNTSVNYISRNVLTVFEVSFVQVCKTLASLGSKVNIWTG